MINDVEVELCMPACHLVVAAAKPKSVDVEGFLVTPSWSEAEDARRTFRVARAWASLMLHKSDAFFEKLLSPFFYSTKPTIITRSSPNATLIRSRRQLFSPKIFVTLLFLFSFDFFF